MDFPTIFLYVTKHIKALHDDAQLITVLKGCHRLLRAGLDVDAVCLIGYAVSVRGNGVTRQRLAELEAQEFSHLPPEERIMQRHVLVTDIAEQKGIEQGIEKERQDAANRMLTRGMPEEQIQDVLQLTAKELAQIKHKLERN